MSRRTAAPPHRHAATPPRHRAAAPPHRHCSYRSHCSCRRRAAAAATLAAPHTQHRNPHGRHACLRRLRPCRYDEDGGGSITISEFKQHFKKRNEDQARAHHPATAHPRAPPAPLSAPNAPSSPPLANQRPGLTTAASARTNPSPDPSADPSPDPVSPSPTRLRWQVQELCAAARGARGA